jgi:PKD repeat protein
MTTKRGTLMMKIPGMAVLALVALLAVGGSGAWAAVQYVGDGALQNLQGGWDLPAQGTCPADPSQATRPDCLALRLNLVQAACVAPNYSWTTSGVCNDLINTTQLTCEAQPDRMWNSGTNVCAIVMKGDDRNNVTCAIHQGTWVTTGTCIGVWVMPARTAYNPPLLTSNGPGDQCLRCHNSETQYNGPRVRDVENYLFHGHKNMARKVTVNVPWGGPPFACTNPVYTDEEECEDHGGTWDPTVYPSDDTGNAIDWVTGRITVSSTPYDMTWIYGDWLSPLPRVIYKAPASSSQVCSDPRYTTANCVANGGSLYNNAGASYSCARCHTTGWTSDAAINGLKEPETSFPGITWDRNSNAGAGVVNLSGGVLNDPNKYASWDVYGIACSRCHSSAVDNTSNGGVAPYNSPTGMSSHHSNLTAADVASGAGYCTDPRFTAQAQCDAAGAAWLTACSVAGVCSNPAYTTSGTCAANGGTWTKYDTSGACTGGGGTFYTSSCNLAGICNDLDPTHNTQLLCEGAGGQWAAASDIIRCLDIHEFGKENSVPAYEAAVWTGSKTNRGQIITALCMGCHRQETSGVPYANAGSGPGTYDTVNPGLNLKVGPAHSTVGFVSHPHGNQFLNSPHGLFTGTFSEIPLGKFNFAGTGLYKSFFQNDGEAANTGNGCTGCHDIHNSVVDATGPEPPIREECNECHAKNLNLVMHPKGGGTPLEKMATEPMEACVDCHMPDGQHLFRIKADASYRTFPTGALTATVNANTSPDGTFTNAVWVDMEHSCGQCHGGGSSPTQITTHGSVPAGSKVLTVDSTAGFVAGESIQIADAGSLSYDDEGDVINGDLETYIVSKVDPSTINLAGAAVKTVAAAAVVQNPTRNGAGYMTRTQLAAYAKGMHNDKPVATFGTTLDSTNTLKVYVDATACTCSGSSANCNAYDWDWGDGTAHGTGVTTNHTYLTAGSKSITLTVTEYAVGSGSKTRTVNVYAPDFPPVAAGTCSLDQDTWIATVTDTSTDDHLPLGQVTVNWGDGGLITSDIVPPFGPYGHTYANAGNFTITHKAIDSIGQQNSMTCVLSPAYFTISGTVFNQNHTLPLSSAIILVKKGTTVVRIVTTASDGTFAAGSLKPGNYDLYVTRTGYTFASPAASKSVGPTGSVGDIVATSGPSVSAPATSNKTILSSGN